ncbi:MAG: TonB-dependent receptor [Woeseiaceae bacterium]|nr:TonB-dependent receptor [Woeseiaceae bacterium]
MRSRQPLVAGSLFISIFLSSGPVVSQDRAANEAVLDEIMVTAQRRVQNLQHVPVSVTAITGDRIREDGITSIRDIALETPNFTFTQFNVGEPEYFIRGIGNTNDSAGADPAVGTFIDDVYIGRTGGTAMDLHELERVEVLRGPQGTLFGKNVVGGAISIYTRKPTSEFASRIGVTVGNYNARTIRGLVNGPITDTVSGNLTISKHDRDGYVDNTIDGLDYQDEDNLSLRGQLLFQPSDSLEILVGMDHSTDDLSGNCRNVNNLALNDPLGLAALYPPVIAARTGGDIRKCASSVAAGQDRDVSGVLLRVDWQLAGSTLTSITAYREADYIWAEDLAGLPLGETPFNLVDNALEDSDQVSQEFRLTSNGGSKLEWLLGAYYMQENVDRSETFIGSFAEPIASQGFALLDGDISFAQNNKTQSYAIFGKLDWALQDTLTLSFGARWAWDDKEIDQGLINNEDPAFDLALLGFLGHPDPQVVLGIPANGPDELFGYLITGDASFLRTPYTVRANDSWNEFLPSASLNWWFSDQSMLYFAVARGYKSGAFQSQTTSPGAAVTPLEPEIATNYEIGLKSEFLYNRVRINASAFRIDYTDLQVFQLVGSLLVGGNAEATSSGLEIDAAAMLTGNWYVGATLGYQNPEYDIYLLGNLDYSGNRLPRASKRSWSLNSNYTLPLQNDSDLNFQVSYAYKSDFYFDPSNVPAALEDGFGLLDARISWKGEHWEISGWGQNLTDEEYRINTFISNIAGTVDLWSLPRTYGVTVAYNF